MTTQRIITSTWLCVAVGASGCTPQAPSQENKAGTRSSIKAVQVLSRKPDDPRLAQADPTIQRWLQTITGVREVRTHQEYFEPAIQVSEAVASGKLSKDRWLNQVVLLLAQMKRGEERWGWELMLLDFSKRYVSIAPPDFLRILVPYLESPDPDVRYLADDMIAYCGARELTTTQDYGDDIVEPPIFSQFQQYLSRCAPADPSWKIVGMMYRMNPDSALFTTLHTYFGNDRPARQQIQRHWKELTVLLLSVELAGEQQKPEFDQKVRAELQEMAKHPHWSVRAYVLGMIHRGRTLRTPRAWATKSDVPSGLRQDNNPLVDQWAKELATQ